MEIESIGSRGRIRLSGVDSLQWFFGGVLFGLLLLESLVLMRLIEHLNGGHFFDGRILEWLPELVLLNGVFIALMVCAGLARVVQLICFEIRAIRVHLGCLSGRLDELGSYHRELRDEFDRIMERRERRSARAGSMILPKQVDAVTPKTGSVNSHGDSALQDPVVVGDRVGAAGSLYFDDGGGDRAKFVETGPAAGSNLRPDWAGEVDRCFLDLCRGGLPGSVILERLIELLPKISGGRELIQVFRDDRLGAALEFSPDPARMGGARQYLAFGSERSGYWLLPKPQRADRNFADLTGFRIAGSGPRDIDRLTRVVSARLRTTGAGVLTISDEDQECGVLEFA
jgi:hypothetical protein